MLLTAVGRQQRGSLQTLTFHHCHQGGFQQFIRSFTYRHTLVVNNGKSHSKQATKPTTTASKAKPTVNCCRRQSSLPLLHSQLPRPLLFRQQQFLSTSSQRCLTGTSASAATNLNNKLGVKNEADLIQQKQQLHDQQKLKQPSIESISELPLTAFESVELSTEQRFLLDKVIRQKKSVFFTGSAGTGKSVLLRTLIEELKQVYLPGNVAVTASTGIAACNIGGCTLHNFAGVRLGQGTVEQLLARLSDNAKAKRRWKKCKVLIIDEVSMIDAEFFDKLEEIARTIKKNKKPFGGIQLIITGDFFQLPPVTQQNPSVTTTTAATSDSSLPSPTVVKKSGPRFITSKNGDEVPIFDDEFSGFSSTRVVLPAPVSTPARTTNKDQAFDKMDHEDSFAFPSDLDLFGAPMPSQHLEPKLCFESKTWTDCIHYRLQLTEVFRQRDPTFVKILDEMRHGKVSAETCKVFDSLKRVPTYPDDGILATELFALKRDVENANLKHLQKLTGPVYVYESMDNGPQSHLMETQSNAPSKLQLKEEAQVMLIKNLTPTLVNGSMGVVVGFERDVSIGQSGEALESYFPIVRFENEPDDLIIRPEEWRLELPDGEVIASRIQVPLILAWAMSIHKSQGQTMSRLKVDMKKIFEAGQAYVALSRATDLAGLQILNFEKRVVKVHEKVSKFYTELPTVRALMDQEAAEEEEKMLLKSIKGKKRSPRKKPVVDGPLPTLSSSPILQIEKYKS